MTHILIEPIAQVRPGGINSAIIAERLWRLVFARGCTQVSMDIEGNVYAMPSDHPFSKSMLSQYADRVVGIYTTDATEDDILGDLIEQWRADREAAA